MTLGQLIPVICIIAIPLIFAITLHEAAHGWVAKKCGDRTAEMLGRLTANPIKHIDPIGTIILPIILVYVGGFIFGWAKPVPVAWRNLNNPRRDMALVALAGPAANGLMAFAWAIIAKCTLIFLLTNLQGGLTTNSLYLLYRAALFGIRINCILLLLNLIPIPPLDGSRVVSSLLPPHIAITYERIEPYGIWILLAFIFLGGFTFFLAPLLDSFFNFFVSLFHLATN